MKTKQVDLRERLREQEGQLGNFVASSREALAAVQAAGNLLGNFEREQMQDKVDALIDQRTEDRTLLAKVESAKKRHADAVDRSNVIDGAIAKLGTEIEQTLSTIRETNRETFIETSRQLVNRFHRSMAEQIKLSAQIRVMARQYGMDGYALAEVVFPFNQGERATERGLALQVFSLCQELEYAAARYETASLITNLAGAAA